MKARINPGFSFFIFVLCYNVREEWYIWIKDGIIIGIYRSAFMCLFSQYGIFIFIYEWYSFSFYWIIYFCMFYILERLSLYCFIHFFMIFYYFDIMDHWYNNKSSDCSYDFWCHHDDCFTCFGCCNVDKTKTSPSKTKWFFNQWI